MSHVAEEDTAREWTIPDGAGKSSRVRSRITAVMAGMLGVAALAGGISGLVWQFTRKPTANELNAAGVKEAALRWRIRTAGELFPPVVKRDQLPTMRRIGIAPATSCAAALDTQVAANFIKHGCKVVLRATYRDDATTVVTTAGIAVMPDAASAMNASGGDWGAPSEQYGLRALAFPGTIANSFGDGQRQAFQHAWRDTPYVVLTTSGWTDGRPSLAKADVQEPFPDTTFLLGQIADNLMSETDPCHAPGVQC